MLRYTPEQIAFLNNQRAAFNASQTAMAGHFGPTGMLTGNAETLPRDVWQEFDREALEIQREVLAVFADLSNSVATPMSIAKLVHHFMQMSDSGEVNISLDGRSKANTDQQEFTYVGTPLPIIDSTFSYGWRQMAAAQSEGFPLDSGGRVNAFYKIAEKMENLMLVGDSKVKVGGDTLYGLTNHPKRNTRTTGQALNGATGAQWQADVKATLKLLHDANYRVGATLYVNFDDWFYAGNTDYRSDSDKSIAQKVREMDGIDSVVPASKVAAGTIIAVVKNRRVLQVLNGMPLNSRAQFRANPEDDYNFVAMAATALELKYDAEDNCGVAHSSL